MDKSFTYLIWLWRPFVANNGASEPKSRYVFVFWVFRRRFEREYDFLSLQNDGLFRPVVGNPSFAEPKKVDCQNDWKGAWRKIVDSQIVNLPSKRI